MAKQPTSRKKPAKVAVLTAAPAKAAKAKQPAKPPTTKIAALTQMLHSKQGATLNEMATKTGWQRHSVRGCISGTLKKRLGLEITSDKVTGRGRVYRIPGTKAGA